MHFDQLDNIYLAELKFIAMRICLQRYISEIAVLKVQI